MRAVRFVWTALSLLSQLFAPQVTERVGALPFGAEGFREAGLGAVRGITVGPIESTVHPGVGYGTDAGRAAIAGHRAVASSPCSRFRRDAWSRCLLS